MDRERSGTVVRGKANFFKVGFSKQREMKQYRIDFAPEIAVTHYKKKIVDANKEKLNIEKYVFDGSSLYTNDAVVMDVDAEFEERPIKIFVRITGQDNSLQTFNLIIRDAMNRLDLQNVKRNYYDAAQKIDIPNGNLELWPGYVTSIREYDNKALLMNAEIIHKFMRKDTIIQITRRLMDSSPQNWKEELEREVVGSTILTDYTNKTYTVDGIDFTKTPKSTFRLATGENKSYADYYEERYNIRIQDKSQFMLVSRARERDIRAGQPENIYLIPELSRATGLTDRMRADFKLMREISEHTRLNPEKRVHELMRFNKRLLETPKSKAVFDRWGAEVSRDLVDIEIRELPNEQIIFGGNISSETDVKAEWNIRGRTTMYETVECKRWILLYPEKIERESRNFENVLIGAAKEMNYIIATPLRQAIQNDRQETYVQEIVAIADKNPKMIVIVLPTNRADRYSAIKKTCLIKYGIPCQVVVQNKVLNHRNLRSICTKIAIQINCKLGGIPWIVKIPAKGLMTIGFDVSHDPRDKKKSIGAMVAQMDLKNPGCCFYSTTMRYEKGNEMVQDLHLHIRKAVEVYETSTGALPEKIVMYRDGISEGQYSTVEKQEINPILDMLREFYKAEPKFAYIVVNKRVNARFFKKVGNGYINPKPGSVISEVVTCDGRNDFYLVSQNVAQGTVAPVYYNIYYNTSELDQNKIEMLTYKLCHLYYNWGGTVRIPNVCQNAKKLAFLTGQSLQTSVNESLVKSLYFL